MQDFWQELLLVLLASFTTSFISTTGVAVAGADDVAVAVTADSSVLFCFFLSILLFIIITPFSNCTISIILLLYGEVKMVFITDILQKMKKGCA